MSHSRFSKALPSVPGLDPAATAAKQLPALPPRGSEVDNDATSVKTTRPMIARKPVGTAATRPGPPPVATTGGLLQLMAPASPSGSLPNLLSAYFRGLDDGGSCAGSSPWPSPGGDVSSAPETLTALAAGSAGQAVASSAPQARETLAGEAKPARPQATSGGGDDDDDDYDDDALLSLLLLQQPTSPLLLPTSPPPPKSQPLPTALTSASPPRPELWRRRSHRSDSNRDLPGLTLSHSHGSTASTSTAIAGSPTLAGSAAHALLDVSPPASRLPAPPPAQSRAMGGRPSKLSQIKNALHRSRPSDGDAGAAPKADTAAHAAHAVHATAQRPPTPEYQTEDGKTAPPVDTLVSPVSPAPSTPPESADASAAPGPSPPSPSHAADRPELESDLSHVLSPAASGAHDTVGLQDLHRENQSPMNSHPPSIRRLPASATELGPDRGRAYSLKMPPRSLSARPDAMRAASQRPRRPTKEGDVRIVHSDTQGPLYRGRDGTLYPEMRVTREPDPRALQFPAYTDKLLEPGTITPARPLRNSHFGCYQRHRNMNRRPNRHCPLACQACGKADADDRWCCTFCHLRICESCMRALDGHHRVLRHLVDELALNIPLSLSSLSRPGSALGLHTTKSA